MDGAMAMSRPREAARLAFEAVNTRARPSLESLVDDIERVTGKPMDIREIPDLGRWGAAALWLDLEDRHLIVESRPVSKHHQRWVRTHEFGHIVYAHLGWTAPPPHAAMSSGMSVAALKTAARSHRINFRRPGELAAEEFARYVDLMTRTTSYMRVIA